MSGDVREAGRHAPEFLQQVLRPRGKRYAGQPFDVSSRHSIQLVPPENGGPLLNAEAPFAVVDYFYHLGKYWRARIPLQSVRHVFGQAFNFSKPKTRMGENGPELVLDRHGVPKRKIPVLNHLQSRFVLERNQPVELYPLHGDLGGEASHRIDDLVYSIEAVGPLGVRFNLRDALSGNLISAHRLMSTQEMVFERIVVENMYVLESPALPLREDQRRAALLASLLRSHHAGMAETYYLYRCCGTNNCSSTPLREIDRIAEYNFLQRLGSLLYRLPLSPRWYLRIRGLDTDPSVRKLVREEFAAFVNDPATAQRKRDYVRSRTQALRAARQRRSG